MAELLRVQGYAATGIQQLAAAAQAPTGSIYHHFRGGKREVAAAALRESGAAYIQLLPLLLDRHSDLATAIEAAFEAAADDIANTGWANMCPVGTVRAGRIHRFSGPLPVTRYNARSKPSQPVKGISGSSSRAGPALDVI